VGSAELSNFRPPTKDDALSKVSGSMRWPWTECTQYNDRSSLTRTDVMRARFSVTDPRAGAPPPHSFPRVGRTRLPLPMKSAGNTISPRFAHSESVPGTCRGGSRETERRERSNARRFHNSERNDCTVSCHKAVDGVGMSWKTRVNRVADFLVDFESKRT
jgi:hypothetical protein